MHLKRRFRFAVVAVLSAGLLTCGTASATDKVTIGLNISLTGARQASGVSTKEGAELLKEQINGKGGLRIGNKQYQLELVYADNESTPEKAVSANLQLITKQNVLGVIGPNASSAAIPAGNIAESYQTPMISPTSTNPKTTENRPFVFRACFLDNFQGEVMAGFAVNDLKANRAAVLYDISSAYPKGLAEFFKSAFEAKKGAGSVTAFESFLPNEKDLTAHLDRIVTSNADVLFLPQYSHEVPAIIGQARARGWNKTILGGDAWEGSDLMPACGDLCKGLYFSTHFAAIGAQGKTKIFVDQYQAKYKALPTGYAALGYDALDLMITAASGLGELKPSLLANRLGIKEKLVAITGFQGVSGTLDMNVAGDPAKSAVVIRINDNGEFESHKVVAP
jgi:branched-chain amino acid transport system substrate-binding protein